MMVSCFTLAQFLSAGSCGNCFFS
jgi:hypothetical protein